VFNVFAKTALMIAAIWASASASVPLQAQTAALQTQAAALQTQAAQSFDGEMLRDPTRPFAATNSNLTSPGNAMEDVVSRALPRSNFKVTFVRDGGSSSMAVINDQRVMIGDLIGGATVVAISSAGVTLSVNGSEQVLTAFGPTVKEVSGTEF
jgi:glucose/arabinose dehydrogenase